MDRPSKASYYLDIALQVAQRGTCLRRNYGAVIVNHDEIVATGYTGAPRGQAHCTIQTCQRAKLQVLPGERYDICRSVHAEANAIISAARRDMLGADLYVVGIDMENGLKCAHYPCFLCKKLIINAGIVQVHILSSSMPVSEWTV